MLERDPALGVRDIWSAACVGDTGTVATMLDEDPGLVDARGGFFDWEPLLYATYSRVQAPGGSTLETARLLIKRGANPNAFYLWGGDYRFTALTGAFGEGEQGPVNQPAHPAWEALARLLLNAGANPNDGQALYNRMFGSCNRCLEILLEYGLNRRHRINWRSGKGRVLDYQLDWAVRNHPGPPSRARRGCRWRQPAGRGNAHGGPGLRPGVWDLRFAAPHGGGARAT